VAENKDGTSVHLPSKKLIGVHVNALKKQTHGYALLKKKKKNLKT
jgi:hypothetical protein